MAPTRKMCAPVIVPSTTHGFALPPMSCNGAEFACGNDDRPLTGPDPSAGAGVPLDRALAGHRLHLRSHHRQPGLVLGKSGSGARRALDRRGRSRRGAHLRGRYRRTRYCWGWNHYGQLGNGAVLPASVERSPVAVGGGLRFDRINTASYASCGVTTTARVFCWGGSIGHLGDGTTSDRSTPGPVSGG